MSDEAHHRADEEDDSDGEDAGGGSSSPLQGEAILTSPGMGAGKTYTYRDFSTIPPNQDDALLSQLVLNNAQSKSIQTQRFPAKLYAILARNEFSDIITWMPHGRSWKVLQPDLFESVVMPQFFEYSNYHSFNRLINAWSFRRISKGVDRGSYYHELFLRGLPHLQKHMRRLPKTHRKLPMKKQDEPDFYAMSKNHPLPEVEAFALPMPQPPGAVPAAATLQLLQRDVAAAALMAAGMAGLPPPPPQGDWPDASGAGGMMGQAGALGMQHALMGSFYGLPPAAAAAAAAASATAGGDGAAAAAPAAGAAAGAGAPGGFYGDPAAAAAAKGMNFFQNNLAAAAAAANMGVLSGMGGGQAAAQSHGAGGAGFRAA